MIVVLDTNVFVSGIHWKGLSEKILNAWLDNRFEIIYSTSMIDELLRVLKDFKISMTEDDTRWWDNSIHQKATIVFPSERISAVKDDPDDNKFIEAAVAGNAKYIVSQDKHLLRLKKFRDIEIINPDDFLRILKQSL